MFREGALGKEDVDFTYKERKYTLYPSWRFTIEIEYNAKAQRPARRARVRRSRSGVSRLGKCFL